VAKSASREMSGLTLLKLAVLRMAPGIRVGASVQPENQTGRIKVCAYRHSASPPFWKAAEKQKNSGMQFLAAVPKMQLNCIFSTKKGRHQGVFEKILIILVLLVYEIFAHTIDFYEWNSIIVHERS